MAVEDNIKRLESAIRALKIQYERFFAGALERPPLEQRNQLETLVRDLTRNPPKALVHRFHINTLVSRFNTLAERWSRLERNREMGIVNPHLSLGSRSAAATTPSPPGRPAGGNGAGPNRHPRISDPATQKDEIRRLYDKFSQLHQKEHGYPPKLPYDSFANSIQKSVVDIMRKSGCKAVDFLVSVGDNKTIRVKAKPIQ